MVFVLCVGGVTPPHSYEAFASLHSVYHSGGLCFCFLFIRFFFFRQLSFNYICFCQLGYLDVFLSIVFSTVRFLLLWSSRFEFETISCTLRCTPSVPGSAPGFPRLPSPAKAPPEAPELVRGLPRTISESWMFSIFKKPYGS